MSDELKRRRWTATWEAPPELREAVGRRLMSLQQETGDDSPHHALLAGLALITPIAAHRFFASRGISEAAALAIQTWLDGKDAPDK